MGFLKDLFDGGRGRGLSDRRSWICITNNIAKEFSIIRNHWFGEVIQVFNNSIEKSLPSLKVVRTRPDRNMENILKAYQLHVFSELMAYRKYIPLDSGGEFADLLYAQVAGEDLDEVVNAFRRYYEVKDDATTQLARFAMDVARFITGNESPLMESLIVGATVSSLVGMTRMAIAAAFNDHLYLQEIKN